MSQSGFGPFSKMASRVAWPSRIVRQGGAAVLVSSAGLLWLQNRATALQNHSECKEPWPSSRPVIAGNSNKPGCYAPLTTSTASCNLSLIKRRWKRRIDIVFPRERRCLVGVLLCKLLGRSGFPFSYSLVVNPGQGCWQDPARVGASLAKLCSQSTERNRHEPRIVGT